MPSLKGTLIPVLANDAFTAALRQRERWRAKAQAERGKSWYRFVKNEAAADQAEVLIYDEIGFWGITAKDFVRDLQSVSAQTLTVRLNSPGGDVFDGVAIYNALKTYAGTVNVKVDGLAASIASVIAMAGESVEMRAGSFLMLHHPWALVVGNATDMREMAATLDKIGASLIDIYAARSGQTPEDVRALMDAVTWLNAEEAIEKGFADAKSEEPAAAASWELGIYGAVPASLPAPASDAVPESSKANKERLLRLSLV